MPEQSTLDRARQDAREGKSPSTQAGEFVREEIDHVREGKHGARSAKQAIAIGLSKARRAGVRLPPPGKGSSSAVQEKAARDTRKGRNASRTKPSARRSRAVLRALKREGHSAASHAALAREARSIARQRGAAARQRSAMKAVRTKGHTGLQEAARKAAQTRRLRSR
jgi:uncharacterized protein DUF6496